jgi:fluoride ion exporter CrcB/FEX
MILSFALETSDMIDKRQFGNVAINILANICLSIEQYLAAGCLQKPLVKD